MPNASAIELAQLLRNLRTAAGLTQAQLANALMVSPSLISSWEKVADPTVPPPERIHSYEEYFRTRPETVNQVDELAAKLAALREQPHGTSAVEPVERGIWHYPDGHDVTIVCGWIPVDRQPLYREPDDPDFVRAHSYSDLDSVIELYGHIRATNPGLTARIKPASELSESDYATHLAVLGGVDWNVATRKLLARIDSLVRQAPFEDNGPPDAAFEVLTDGEVTKRFQPVLGPPRTAGGKGTLIEDFGQFIHGPNPYNRRRTLTMCNGMYGRGVLGAVRALTDKDFLALNLEFLRHHQPAGGGTVGVLFRVEPHDVSVHTPDWTEPGIVVHTWSRPAA